MTSEGLELIGELPELVRSSLCARGIERVYDPPEMNLAAAILLRD